MYNQPTQRRAMDLCMEAYALLRESGCDKTEAVACFVTVADTIEGTLYPPPLRGTCVVVAPDLERSAPEQSTTSEPSLRSPA